MTYDKTVRFNNTKINAVKLINSQTVKRIVCQHAIKK